MKINLLLEKLLAKKDLSSLEITTFMTSCMRDELSDVQIAAFLVLLRMKGETIEELSAAAKTMHQFAHHLNLGSNLVDIVGTGGDCKNTFNISTASSFVVAAAGFKVAKHGNRSVSSQTGSADLLEKAGFKLDLNEDAIKKCLDTCNICFLFAPNYHPALRYVRPARQQLGIKTFFNLLGPLLNPAHVKRQVVGVSDYALLKPIAEVLANLGSERTLVLHSQDGMDEISICAPTDIIEWHSGNYKSWIVNPKEYDMHHTSLENIVVNSPLESLNIIEKVFQGEKGPARDIVALNAAAAIYLQSSASFSSSLEQAKDAIESGKAAACFQKLQKLTVKLSQ